MADTSREASFVTRARGVTQQLVNSFEALTALANEKAKIDSPLDFDAYFTATPEPVSRAEFDAAMTQFTAAAGHFAGGNVARDLHLFKE